MTILVTLEASRGGLASFVRSSVCHFPSYVHNAFRQQRLCLVLVGQEHDHRSIHLIGGLAEPSDSLNLYSILLRHGLGRCLGHCDRSVRAESSTVDAVDFDGVLLFSKHTGLTETALVELLIVMPRFLGHILGREGKLDPVFAASAPLYPGTDHLFRRVMLGQRVVDFVLELHNVAHVCIGPAEVDQNRVL